MHVAPSRARIRNSNQARTKRPCGPSTRLAPGCPAGRIVCHQPSSRTEPRGNYSRIPASLNPEFSWLSLGVLLEFSWLPLDVLFESHVSRGLFPERAAFSLESP